MGVTMHIEKKRLISDFSKSLELNNAALFIGAGLSVSSGYFDWSNILKRPAKQLELDVEKEKHDLTLLAQFYENRNNRQSLNEILVDEFSRTFSITRNHEIIAKLPIQTVWTTNYDKLIEKAYENEGKKCDVKHEDNQLKSVKSDRDVVLYKMHGDIDHPNDLVITRDDYQFFDKKHELFREVLEADLVTKTFLFLGFSFSDPNLKSIIGKLRILLENKPRNHYCIFKKVSKDECEQRGFDYEYENRKQEYFVDDLRRFGILVCLIDDYSEITEILDEIETINRRKTIFVSGSAVDYSPFTNENAIYFIQTLSRKISENRSNYKIINGFGKGIGEFIINGVTLSNLETKKRKIHDSLTILPFPTYEKEKSKKKKIYEQYRSEMIQKSGISLYLFGNKYESQKSKNFVNSTGMIEEFNLAIQYKSLPLPIKITGGSSNEIFGILEKGNFDFKDNKFYEEALDTISNLDDLDINKRKDIDTLIKRIINAINLLSKLESEDD